MNFKAPEITTLKFRRRRTSAAPSRTTTTMSAMEDGLRLLMWHFAAYARKATPGGCARCRRLLQLFRLHASVCDRPEQDQPCRVPLCR